jgi:hypothetical protein
MATWAELEALHDGILAVAKPASVGAYEKWIAPGA